MQTAATWLGRRHSLHAGTSSLHRTRSGRQRSTRLGGPSCRRTKPARFGPCRPSGRDGCPPRLAAATEQTACCGKPRHARSDCSAMRRLLPTMRPASTSRNEGASVCLSHALCAASPALGEIMKRMRRSHRPTSRALRLRQQASVSPTQRQPQTSLAPSHNLSSALLSSLLSALLFSLLSSPSSHLTLSPLLSIHRSSCLSSLLFPLSFFLSPIVFQRRGAEVERGARRLI